MEKYTSVEEVTGGYNREEVAEKAHGDAQTLLAERYDDFSKLPTVEKITALKTLIAELAATKEGTDNPINNGNRGIVEALAKLRVVEEKRSEIEAVTARYPEFA